MALEIAPESVCDCGHSHKNHADSPMGWCDSCSCTRFLFDQTAIGTTISGQTVHGLRPPSWPIGAPVCRCGEYQTCEACLAEHRRSRAARPDTEPAPPPAPSGRWPTLEAIGLLDAIDELEKVAASNADKHGRKWLTKSLSWHDGKAVKHLGAAQAGQPKDADTGLPSRAHAALRLVMSLALELMRGPR